MKDFFTYLQENGFFADKELIENYLLALKVNPFVILTGNSGTGKTKLSRLFAKYLSIYYDYLVDDSLDKSSILRSEDDEDRIIYDNCKIVPVGANWTENRNIVGYKNIITGDYETTPAYDLIISALENFYDENTLTRPYFLILDEMNLSHVERYFADFLSAIESDEKIPIYGADDLEIPPNLFVIGTVNVDETTYMFSPKVLDRANVIEFKTYPAEDYMNNLNSTGTFDKESYYLFDPLSDLEIRECQIIKNLITPFSNVDVEGYRLKLDKLLAKKIYEFQEVLEKSNFDFGFRVIDEIIKFMLVAWKYEGRKTNFKDWERYFDAQIKQKMLPKLHGSEKVIGDTLKELHDKCLLNDTIIIFPESKEKLEEMKKMLKQQRYMSFIN